MKQVISYVVQQHYRSGPADDPRWVWMDIKPYAEEAKARVELAAREAVHIPNKWVDGYRVIKRTVVTNDEVI